MRFCREVKRWASSISSPTSWVILGAFLVPTFILLKPLPGNVALPLSSFKAAVGLSLGVILLGWLTQIPLLGLIAVYVMTQWWIFGLAKWSVMFILFFMGWLGWLIACQRVGERTRVVEWAFVFAAIVQVIFMVMQVYQVDPVMKSINSVGVIDAGAPQPIVGLFSNPSDVGIFLALVLPLALVWGQPLSAVISLIIVLGIVLSKSSAALAGGLSVLGVWFGGHILKGRISRWWALSVIPIAGGMVAWLVKVDPLSQSLMRVELWGRGLTIWKISPWIGLGPGAMGSKWRFIYRDSAWTMFQNEYLESLFNGGVIGFTLILLLIAFTAWRCFGGSVRPQIWMGLVAVAVVSTVSIPFHIMPTAMLAAYFLGQTWRAT